MLAGVYIACIAAYLSLILQAWFAIFMYLIIGGVCVFFASFKATRFLTVAWFRAMCHEGLTIIFSGLIMGISGNIIHKLVRVLQGIDVGANGIFTPQYFAVLLACAMGYLMLLKAPQLAAAISGGSAGSTAGVAAAVGAVAGMGYGAAKSAAGWGVRSGGRALGRVGQATRENLWGNAGDSGGQSAKTPAMGAYTARKGTSTGQT